MTVVMPEFLKNQSYSAKRDRLAFQHGGGIQPGTWGMDDLVASQRAAGANMSVDVSAGYGVVAGTTAGNAGYYHLQNDAVLNVPSLVATNPTNPRWDILILQVEDTDETGSTDAGRITWVTGTPNASAAITSGVPNYAGVGTVPSNSLELARVLIPASGSPTITTANIIDRRASARQGWFKVATVQATGSANNMVLSCPNMWGLVDHVKVTGKARSLRAGITDTGCRFRVNGVSAANYSYIHSPSNVTPTTTNVTQGQTSGYIGQMPAATSGGTGPTYFELELLYCNSLDGLDRLARCNTWAYISGTQLMAADVYNEMGGIASIWAARTTSVTILGDTADNLTATSFADLWVFGG